jgi:hypothetical protein
MEVLDAVCARGGAVWACGSEGPGEAGVGGTKVLGAVCPRGTEGREVLRAPGFEELCVVGAVGSGRRFRRMDSSYIWRTPMFRNPDRTQWRVGTYSSLIRVAEDFECFVDLRASVFVARWVRERCGE